MNYLNISAAEINFHGWGWVGAAASYLVGAAAFYLVGAAASYLGGGGGEIAKVIPSQSNQLKLNLD